MRLVWLFLLLGGLSHAWSSDDSTETAKQWLERMNQAVKSLNYEGHFVYQCHDSLEAMHIRHWQDSQGTHESLYSLTGTAREVLRDDKRLTIITNRQGKLQIRQQPTQGKLTPVKSLNAPSLERYYRLSMCNNERLAGREAVVIELQPRDGFRYGYRIAVDKISALPLGLTVFDEHEGLLSRIMFTDLKIYSGDELTETGGQTAETRDMLSAGAEETPRVVAHAIQPDQKMGGWRFSKLPPGYFLSDYQKIPAQSIEHFVFTDGLATISAYVEPMTAENALQGQISLGAVNAYGKIDNGHQLTLVGEVPVQALKLLASGWQRSRK